MLSHILAMAGAAAAQTPTAAPSDAAWPHYSNARYAYDVCYLATQFTPEPEADAGDGRKFAGADGAQMLIFGQYNVTEATLAKWAEDQAKTYINKRGKITHRALHPGLAVLSGTDGKGNLFYTRTLAKGDRFVSLQFRYPARHAKRFQPIIEKTSQCLSLTD